MKLVFNIIISGDAGSWFIDNLAANLINRIEMKWGTKSVLNINNYDVLNSYKNLWLTSNQRANSIRRRIQLKKLSKLISGATSGTANASDTRLKRIFGNKYELLLDSKYLTDQHPFYPCIYKEDIKIDLNFEKSSLLINSTDAEVVFDYN